jgi:hypothetical protein
MLRLCRADTLQPAISLIRGFDAHFIHIETTFISGYHIIEKM